MRRVGFLLLIAALGLGGCVQNPATGGMMFTTVSSRQELTIGQQTAEEAIKAEGLFDPQSSASKIVERVGRRVWAQTERSQEPLQLLILDSDTYNAWATPGYINVYRGILPYLESEAELAALLGHESGHITARHTAQQMTQNTALSVAATAAAILVAAKTNNAGLIQATGTLGGLGVAYSMGAFSRADEEQADALALRYLAAAGYDPKQALNLIDRMGAYEAFYKQTYAAFHEGKAPTEDLNALLMRSHPRTPQRRADLLKKAGGEPDGGVTLPPGVSPATEAGDPLGRVRFLMAISGLPVGPQLKYGVAGRGYIAFPKARVWLALPDGMFVRPLEPAKPRFEAVHPVSGLIIRAGIEDNYTTGLSPAAALKKIFPKANRLEPFTLADGTTAWLARGQDGDNLKLALAATPPQQAKQKDILFVASATLPPGAAGEADAVLSIWAKSRLLTASEAERFRPLHLAVRTVRAGDTVASLGASLPQGALGEAWFQAINSLPDGARLPVGGLYKTVVDGNPRF